MVRLAVYESMCRYPLIYTCYLDNLFLVLLLVHDLYICFICFVVKR